MQENIPVKPVLKKQKSKKRKKLKIDLNANNELCPFRPLKKQELGIMHYLGDQRRKEEQKMLLLLEKSK